MKFKTSLLMAAAAVAVASMAQAAVTPEELKLLGTKLTPWGAEVAANKDGTIPAYTGGIKPPPDFNKDNGKWPDPFPGDKPLYTITAANMAQYADKLTPGAQELLKRHDTFAVNVYPTRRGYSMPKHLQDGSIKNAANPECKMVKEGEAIVGCWAGVPFPIPKNGMEAMWNFQLRFTADYLGKGSNWLVNSAGQRVMILATETNIELPYWNGHYKPYEGGGQYARRFLSTSVAPARDAGNLNVQWYPFDYLDVGQKTWTYTPGQRRVRMAPEFTYDTPIATLGAALLFDEIGLFAGRMNRHDYKLVGKKEMIIPYNNYRSANITAADTALGPKHENPEITRWEMRRVWVVEATIKPGVRHVAHKRNYYIDEDSWDIMATEGYDASGKIFRTIFSHSAPNYANGGVMTFNSGITAYDLNKGQYLYMGYMGKPTDGVYTNVPRLNPSDLTPEGMLAKGVR